MARRKLSEAVHLISVRGVSAAQAARDLDVHATVLRRWVNAAQSKGVQAFPGNGKLSPDDEELRRLRREVVKLKAERDILKKGETIFRHWSEDNGRTPTSPGTRSDVRVHGEAPRCMAS